MQAYGSDRVAVRDDGRITLDSRRAKPGWEPRTPRTMTRREHPGTAILWDDQYYEVVEVKFRASGVRYTLAPWADEHAIRVADRYDAESETQRASEHRAAVSREKNRKRSILLGFLAGHLPEVVQLKMESELGVSATKMTVISLIPGVVLLGVVIHLAAGAALAQKPSPVPFWVVGLAAYFLADGGVRLNIAWLHGRPIGSPIGFIAYLVFWLLHPRRSQLVSPFAEVKGTRLFKGTIAPDVVERDAFRVREPFFTLLTPQEQARLAELHGFDYSAHATSIAGGILIFSILGTITSVSTLIKGFSPTALISLLVAAYLTYEQISRLKRFKDGPVGSALAFLVRPMASRFLKSRSQVSALSSQDEGAGGPET